MKKIAIYGKGGIGKSTTVSNVAVALAKEGYTVMQIGCDPKADSTLLLRGQANNEESQTGSDKAAGKIKTVLDLIREKGNNFTLDEMAVKGECGIICVEAGGPTPGVGCAGRGIIAALDKLKEKGAYEVFKPDVVLYDVLGDVVCGGFSMPMRAGYADRIYIITSGENMAIHAAANIAMAVDNFKEKGYATLGGLILNRRDVKNEEEKVNELAGDFNTQVVGKLTRSETVLDAEELGKTVVEAFPESSMAEEYRVLAKKLIDF
ncbi:MAG: AAA family ATPase [Lachnospiraceae bacterium]|nr:AAA family ATPase [Lachnospiraceae bacterium]